MKKELENTKGLEVSDLLYLALLEALAEEGIDTNEKEQECLENVFLGIIGDTEN